MTRKSFILSILNAAPVLAAAGLLKSKSSTDGSVVLIRKFYPKNGNSFDHQQFNKIIESSFDMKYIQADHQFMLDTQFIKKFERENFNSHVVFKIHFKNIKDLEAYKNKISKIIVDRTPLIDQFENKDEVLPA